MKRLSALKRRIGIVVCLAMLVVGAAVPVTGVSAQRAVCKTYDQAEFYLVTGIDSEYGGTICVR